MEKIGADIFVETVYPGVNVGFVGTEAGAICIDTPLLPGEAQRWRERMRSLGVEDVRFVIYTTGHQERALGAQYFVFEEQSAPPAPPPPQISRPRHILFPRPAPPVSPETGWRLLKAPVVAQRSAWEQVKELSSDGFKQSMVDTFGERDPDLEKLEVILPQITFDKQIKLFAGEVTVELIAAAIGVAWVWFPEQQVLFASDTIVVGTHPPLEVMDVREWIAALKRLTQEPRFEEAVIVPGRGPVGDISDVDPMIEYLSEALQRTKAVQRAGRSKADLNAVAADLLSLFPVADGQKERVQRQIKLGLDELYDDLKNTDLDAD
jgi:glyoxylase-like metal-dependent hydrolase (beta-lactamase superfamily II)